MPAVVEQALPLDHYFYVVLSPSDTASLSRI